MGDWLTTAEAAELVRLSPQRLREMARAGRFSGIVSKPSGRLLWKRAALEEWISRGFVRNDWPGFVSRSRSRINPELLR